MSIDKSLKSDSATSKHRNVLRRAERIVQLQEEDRWDENSTAHGLVKVASRKIKVGAKTKKKGVEGDEAATTEEANKD